LETSYTGCLAGLDDGFFEKNWEKTLLALAVHCTCRDILVPASVYLEPVTVDGMDVTEATIQLLRRARYEYNIAVLFTDTVIFAGFNILDPEKVYQETSVPVVTVNLYPHNQEKIRRALEKHFPDHEYRLKLLKENWKRQKQASCRKGRVLIAAYGISYTEAWRLLCRAQVYSREPEPLYTAGVLASAATKALTLEEKTANKKYPHN